ncbi:MAG: hypothetical protein U1D00_05870 [Mycobacterium sp.]|nr:hypothetical protein [Mycobacterium sp.]
MSAELDYPRFRLFWDFVATQIGNCSITVALPPGAHLLKCVNVVGCAHAGLPVSSVLGR